MRCKHNPIRKKEEIYCIKCGKKLGKIVYAKLLKIDKKKRKK